MVTVGMLSHRKDPTTVFKSYAYAAVAKMEGVDFYFFSPSSVNFHDQTILGWIYEDGQWIQKKRPFPDVIYNASPPMTDKQEEIVDGLYELIPFTSHSIGDKITIYQKIKEAKTFADYLIPSIIMRKPQDVMELLNRYKYIIIKPISGHKGKKILLVWEEEEIFIIQQVETKTILKSAEFKGFIDRLIKNDSYLVQPYIKSQTKKGIPFHLRLHVQKDEAGKWSLTTIFPCIAYQGIVANLSSGGHSMMFEEFLKREFGDEYYNVKRYLEQFSIQFSNHFDSLYDNILDELGIDVGLDINQKIWIFEVNWRPGTPPTFSLELDVAKKMIRYARYLAENSKRSPNIINN